MGAGASAQLTKEEAMAAAPDAGATFSDEAWEALEKDGEGKVSCDTLKAAASKRDPAPRTAAARARAVTRRRLQVCRGHGERARRRRGRPGRRARRGADVHAAVAAGGDEAPGAPARGLREAGRGGEEGPRPGRVQVEA